MILLFSGGLDSYIAWEYLNRPKTIYFDLGHRYAADEVSVVRKLISDTIIDSRLNLADWEEPDANIPMRNAFLVMMASHYDQDIILVVQKGEMEIPDRTRDFLLHSGKEITRLRKNKGRLYVVSSPFIYKTKTQMVRWYIRNQFEMEPLLQTRSCYTPGDLPCGACSACFRRWVAFQNCGVSEKHVKSILNYNKIPEYVEKMMKGEYDKQRTEETLNALTKVGYL